jgi:hypothetical protein
VAGKIKQMIDRIVNERSKGNETIRITTIAKLTLKGINAAKYTGADADDPEVIAKLQQAAIEMGVKL